MSEDGVDLDGTGVDKPENRYQNIILSLPKRQGTSFAGTDLSAAWQTVPQVSAMSSTKMATRSLTSPTRTMRSTSLAFFLSLWMRAKSTFKRSAMDVTLHEEHKGSKSSGHPFAMSSSASFGHWRVSGGSPFGSACIRGNDYAVFPLRDVFFYPLKNSRFSVKIVYCNVKKSLEKSDISI